MKKVLSFLLIFMVSLTLIGVSQDVSADSVDVTIYLHIYEHDGDYTGSGTGLYDGTPDTGWLGWLAHTGTEDEFGAVVEIPYTAAALAAAGDSFEFKPTNDIAADNAETLLAPGEGKVFLDVTDLKAGSIDGTMTELHAYYVEGAKDFYIKEVATNGVFLFIYSNPQVAANENIYDGWGLHTWNVGTNGTARPDYWDFPEFDIDVELDTASYTVPMRLGAIEVDADASNEVGFIVHFGVDGDEEDKAYWDADIFADVELIKPNDTASDPLENGGVSLSYYEHGAAGFTADYATFIANTETEYFNGLKNKFVEGTVIADPDTVEVSFFGVKQPYELVPGRFIVKDSDEVVVPITSVTIEGTKNITDYVSDVTVQSETVVVLYVDTALAHDTLGIAGSMQSWSPENAVVSTVDDVNGYAVFEFTSFDAEVQFALLTEDGVDDVETLDVDESTTLTWGDTKISGDDNLVVDLSGGGVVEVYFNDTDNSYFANPAAPHVGYSVDATTLTYTTSVTCTEENMLTVFVETAADHTQLGIVGSFNGWDVANAVAPIGETGSGLVVFEICDAEATGEFKVKQDPDADGFTWDAGLDPEITSTNVAYDFGEMTEMAVQVDVETMDALALELVHVPVLEPTSIYRLSVYVIGGDDSLLGITGGITDPTWSPGDAITPTHMDEFGNSIFDIELTGKTGDFKLLYDMDEDGFEWDDATTADNISFDLGTDTVGYLVIDLTDSEVEDVMYIGSDVSIDGNTTGMLSLNMGGELMYGEMYTVEYIETPAMGETPAEMIMWDLGFNTSLRFVEPNVVEEMGTYAVSPTEIQIEFDHAAPLMTVNSGLTLYRGMTMITLFPNDLMFTNGSLGDYTPTVTCEAGNNLLFVHFNAMDTTVETLAQLGMVGSVQTGDGWDIDNPLNPIGMDSEGNYVFEICVEDTKLEPEFKILYDISADGFAWSNDDDVELVSGNVKVTAADEAAFYLEEGNEMVDASAYHTLMVSAAFSLDSNDDFTLEFMEDNGFTISMVIDKDTEAPVVNATISGVSTEIDTMTTDFDIMDYFTILTFIDNREGALEFELTNELDLTTAGVQTLTISASDMWGNTATHDIDFTVVDTTNPVITVEGAKAYDAGTAAPDWASFATTNEGTITVDATQVDMDTAGVFYVNYTAEDASGNQALGSIEVTINAVEETVADTGCFSSISVGSTIVILVAALGGAALFFTRKHQ